MKAVFVLLTAVAALLGGAGGLTLALERRLTTLTPGGVQIEALHYNPLSGHLALAGVRARDAGGREVFRADSVVATASPLPLLVGSLRLARVRVAAPRLTLTASDVLGANLPLHVEDLAVTGGSVVVEGASARGAPLHAHDVEVRLGRLTTARDGHPDVAFAMEMTTYGTLVRATGQPRGAGYAVHVRARDLDVAALARDVPGGLAGLQAGRGEVDAVLQLTGGRLLASGHARVADLVMALPVRGQPRLRAATVTVVADGVDLVSGAGRLARVVIGGPSLSLPVATAGPTLAALLERLRTPAGLLVRRVAVTDGTLALTGAGGVRLERMQVVARTPERHGAGSWAVSARAALDRRAVVALEGVLARDLRALDAAARMRRVGLTPWRALTGMATDWDVRVSFEGRLRGAAREALTLSGQAVLADAEAGAPGGHHVDVNQSVPYQAAGDLGGTVRLLLSAVEHAAHMASLRF
jgi:hypothetical protein